MDILFLMMCAGGAFLLYVNKQIAWSAVAAVIAVLNLWSLIRARQLRQDLADISMFWQRLNSLTAFIGVLMFLYALMLRFRMLAAGP